MSLTESIIIKLFDKLLESFVSSLTTHNLFEIDTRNVSTRLGLNVERGIVWASEISVERLIASRTTKDVYVDLEIDEAPGFTRKGRKKSLRVSRLKSMDHNIVLLGDSGAGKTTSLKSVYINCARNYKENEIVPILIRARNISKNATLTSTILTTCGLFVTDKLLDDEETQKMGYSVIHVNAQRMEYTKQELAHFLDVFSARVFIDGVDEAPPGKTSVIFDELEYFVSTCKRATFFITSRTATYRTNLPNTHLYFLKALSEKDVNKIATKWIGRENANKLALVLSGAPYSGTEVRPLTLIHLCHVFLRKGGRLPEYSRNIYRTITKLFMEDWDIYRRVERRSVFDDFEPDRKQEFLEALSYNLAKNEARGFFTHEQLRDAYIKICNQFSLTAAQNTEVLREIESHTGLVLEVGDEGFEFYHISIQEYLCGEFLVKAGGIAWEDRNLIVLPNEYAIAVGLSSDPTSFLIECVKHFFDSYGVRTIPSAGEMSQFVDRLTTEKANWRSDAKLGLALVLLDDAQLRGNGRCSWAGLLSHSEVRESLKEFFQYCTVGIKGPNKLLIIQYESMRGVRTDFTQILYPLGSPRELFISDELASVVPGRVVYLTAIFAIV